MLVRSEAVRRQIEAEFVRGLSPLKVTMEWDQGSLQYQVGDRPPAILPRTNLTWNQAMESIKTVRAGLLRDGVKLDPWEPPPAPTLS